MHCVVVHSRVLDFLVDLNESSHIPKERRHNIGSPSRATPPRFLSPEVYAARYGKYPELEDNGDVEEMKLDAAVEDEPIHVVVKESQSGDDNESSDDDDDDDDDEKTPVTGRGSKYNSDDDDGDTSEAYREEIREWNYKRGIAGTPPRSVREKMKADAESVRKEAEQHAKQAAKAAVAAVAEHEEKKSNGTNNSSAVQIKQEKNEDEDEAELYSHPADDAPQPPLIVEDYRRGHTPEYLRSGSSFLMTLKEEEEWYEEIEEKYDGGVPPLEHPCSPSVAKAESDPRNPVSVYCWLRKNQPQVFLQNEEVEGKKLGRGRGGRRKAVEADSGDEGMNMGAGKTVKSGESSKAGPSKRRRGNDATGGPPAPGGTGGKGRGGPRGGRKGEPPLRRQRR